MNDVSGQFAQQMPQQQQVQIPADAMLTLELTAQEWQFVLMGVHKIPYELAQPLLPKMMAQLQRGPQPVDG